MNYKLVLKNLGIVLVCEALLMLLPLITAILYRGTDISAFIYAILITMAAGFPPSLLKTDDEKIYAREGFAIVSLGWILISIFGALPFYFSGSIPDMFDCLFETVSGFTTTGASILPDVESLPKGILFWRSFTHWVGGLGVLVFFLAILPKAGASTFQIMKAESPGPSHEKLVPRIGKSARDLYIIYLVITMVLVVLLLSGGMSLYDALIHAFGTAGTGGFSNKNTSVGFYDSVYFNVVIGFFMLIFGANLALYYQMITGNVKALVKDEQFRFFIKVVVIAIILITLNIYINQFYSLGESLEHAFFQASSIITTTGYASTDFNNWPLFSRMILIFLMFIGGCAGSTAGSIKSIRILLLFKVVRRELLKAIHPQAVNSVRIDGKIVEEGVLSGVAIFFFTYMLIFAGSVLALSLEGHNFEVAVSAAAACIGNIGPGLGAVGPVGNYSLMSNASKILLSLDMLIGRLEIFPILLLFIPSFWKRVSM